MHKVNNQENKNIMEMWNKIFWCSGFLVSIKFGMYQMEIRLFRNNFNVIQKNKQKTDLVYTPFFAKYLCLLKLDLCQWKHTRLHYNPATHWPEHHPLFSSDLPWIVVTLVVCGYDPVLSFVYSKYSKTLSIYKIF